MSQAGKGDLRTLANGLFPLGFDPATLPPEGRDEVRAAVDAILKLWDYMSAKATLALEELDRAATEIERLSKIETAARALKFSAYPAHGSGFVIQVTGGNINDLEAALKSAE